MSTAAARPSFVVPSVLIALALILFYFLTAPAFAIMAFQHLGLIGPTPPSVGAVRLYQLAESYAYPYYWLILNSPMEPLLTRYQDWCVHCLTP